MRHRARQRIRKAVSQRESVRAVFLRQAEQRRLDESLRLHKRNSRRLPQDGDYAYLSCSRVECVEKKIYGVQFHPEVNHTEYGRQILKNFLYSVCKIEERWSIGNLSPKAWKKSAKRIGDGKVLCALSGGMDSAVAAALVQKGGRRPPDLRLR